MLKGSVAPTAGAFRAYVRLAEVKFVTSGIVTCRLFEATSQLGSVV
jgi:hypothetical protein